MRFLLDFGYATGLRISELTQAMLRNVEVDAAGDHWLHVVGKGGKPAKVTLTPLARVALDRYLQERGLPISRARWEPATPLVGSVDGSETGITALRLWEVMRRFFRLAADSLASDLAPCIDFDHVDLSPQRRRQAGKAVWASRPELLIPSKNKRWRFHNHKAYDSNSALSWPEAL